MHRMSQVSERAGEAAQWRLTHSFPLGCKCDMQVFAHLPKLGQKVIVWPPSQN